MTQKRLTSPLFLYDSTVDLIWHLAFSVFLDLAMDRKSRFPVSSADTSPFRRCHIPVKYTFEEQIYLDEIFKVSDRVVDSVFSLFRDMIPSLN